MMMAAFGLRCNNSRDQGRGTVVKDDIMAVVQMGRQNTNGEGDYRERLSLQHHGDVAL